MTKPHLIFDAGGTIVFPDFTYMEEVVNKIDIWVSKDELFNIHCDLIYDLDVQTHQSGHLADPFPNGYPDTLLKGILTDNEQRDAIINTIEERSRQKSLWTASFPWVKESLDLIKSSGFSMSVVSNSDGRVNQILKDLDLISFFDQVFDSDIIGYSKPDSRLFNTALNALNLEPDEALYIGDVYYIDVWGANQAGIGAIHLDPRSLYKDWQGVHIRSVANLPGLLSLYLSNPASFDLFPTRGISISF
jgi:HAD superfamily hydrolase (TIGR01549 family)